MPLPVLPLETRSQIFSYLNDTNIAEHIPEAFWAMAPDYIRHLHLSWTYNFDMVHMQTKLVDKYPNCGHLVKRLSILSDQTSAGVVTKFLQNFPPYRKLKHLQITLAAHPRQSITSASALPFLSLLETLIATSPNLQQISFVHIHPSPLLINAAAARLTRLDIGHFYPSERAISVPLTPLLEILSVTASVFMHITDTPPATLRTVIIKTDILPSFFLMRDCHSFLARCTHLTGLAIVDRTPRNSPLIAIVKNLKPPILNVCFKFTQPYLDAVKNVQEMLLPGEVTFKICTFILCMSAHTASIQATCRDNTQLFVEAFNLDACFIYCGDKDLHPEAHTPAQKEILKEWVHIVDALGN
ncbi:hypothetical protein BYT27DRAFT_7255055 [Phlegmacium glaucopus]|nr:hypothetical protein BYT27DRAFT_7255055 [Phlegmacium glaucopus]